MAAMNRRQFGVLATRGIAVAALLPADGLGRGQGENAGRPEAGQARAAKIMAGNGVAQSPYPKFDEPRRTTPIVADVDVVVAGGGPAGFVAAIAAARQGRRTLLLERYGFLGGGLTAGGVLNIRPFHVAPGKVMMDGIPLEYVRRLQQLGGTRLIPQDYIPIQQEPELSKFVIQEMVLEAGVQLLLHSRLVGAARDGDRISLVLVENKSGRQAIRAKVFVDCTGDADLAWHAGAPWLKGGPRARSSP